ncbi:hypothetical protein ACFP3I_11300 [Chryseobacterium arachidis]
MVESMEQERVEASMEKATKQAAFNLKNSKFHDFNGLSNFHFLKEVL